jgi:hypothetical protein
MSSEPHVPQEHPSPHRGRVSLVALLLGLGIGPAAWAAQLMLGYGLSSYACFPGDQPFEHAPPPGWSGERPGLLAVNLACLVVALAGCWISWASWRSTRQEKGGGSEALLRRGEGRSRFLALCGLLASAGFAVAILFDTAAILGVPACWDTPS